MISNISAMEELIVELQLFLQLLDHEYLTTTVREKKAVLSNILLRIQSSKDFEIKENAQKQEVVNNLPAPPQMPLPEIPQQWLPPDNGPPPLPSSSLPEGYYEEAVPLSPGKAPEYITSNYDSDAMSSSYESYDEEDEDGKGKKMRHQWPSEEASMDLVKDAKICAFLLRKKRFGQWTKLLCVIKENKLLCYKSSKDQQPQMELLLSGCNITYIPKDSKKKKHELKITHQGQDALVLAVQSKEQADQWLKVIKEVCSNCVGAPDSDGPSSNSPVHKTELEKKLSSERPSSDGEGIIENGIAAICNGKEQVKRKKSSKTDSKGTVSKVTGKKITKIIGLGKKKPSTDEQTSSAEEDIPTCGYLNVLSNNRWRERWCRVKDNKLIFHKDRTDLKTHIVSIPLRGCEVIPGLDSKHPLTFRLLRNAQEVAVLEASSSEDMGRWIGILLAESGSSADPGTLHYDYIDVDMTASVIQAAKQTFCFMNRRVLSTNPYRGNAANGYACPSGMALHYDDVPCINGSVRIDLCFKGKKASAAANGIMGKGRTLNPQKKSEFSSNVKRSTSNAEQYKYGKNRVEADAKRLQTKEEELLRRKETLRNRLAQLRKERKDLRAALEVNAGRKTLIILEDKLKKLEEECKLKESERVTLELELTEVKENLKKALAGGITLGLAIEPKSGTSTAQSPVLKHQTLENSPISSCDTSDTECSVPVNSAVVLKRHSSSSTSPCRGHVLQKAKEWELKNGT
ncbi:actin filament-associated protein 1 isoform X3 [Rhineura floridana]|uniref:actin filament-associated protein 1 isoform X3 n=1 Tax=Rhineura floridana TaxID=261503 RepID=UPI002AC7F528|nr:actin filament-associated protein 1 isoform X3 [Rhineura floridana]